MADGNSRRLRIEFASRRDGGASNPNGVGEHRAWPGRVPDLRAVSSAVEHYLDMVGVTGSNPVPPTTRCVDPFSILPRRSLGLPCVQAIPGAHRVVLRLRQRAGAMSTCTAGSTSSASAGRGLAPPDCDEVSASVSWRTWCCRASARLWSCRRSCRARSGVVLGTKHAGGIGQGAAAGSKWRGIPVGGCAPHPRCCVAKALKGDCAPKQPFRPRGSAEGRSPLAVAQRADKKNPRRRRNPAGAEA